MRKKYIILSVILVLIFSFFYYNLSEEKNIENILNNKFKYEANVEVEVYSNKNQNKYNLKIKEDRRL